MITDSTESLTAVRELARTISRKFDTDQDGKLSHAEFDQFFTSFLGAFSGASNPAPAGEPRSFVADRPAIGVMAGFDHGKLADSSVDTTKYRIGRILQGYPNTPEGLRAALPAIQQIVPGVTIAGSLGDKLDFGNYVDHHGHRIGVIDVIEAATPGNGGRAWQWLPVA